MPSGQPSAFAAARRRRSRRMLAAVIVAAGASAGVASAFDAPRYAPKQSPAASPTPVPTVVIDEPREGARTREGTVLVRGRAPMDPEEGATVVTLTVDGRKTETYANGGRFRDRIVLSAGRNRISASAEVMFFEVPLPGSDEDDSGEARGSIFTTPSEPVHVTRRPDRTFGRLDLATALLVAEDHGDVYWLCGEADGCLRQQVCVRVGERRVDCPVRYRFEEGDPITCGVVISVHLRGRRLFFYSYGCGGRWSAAHKRFVRREIERTGRRYRIDERGAPWIRSELTDANRYGIPRFDIDRDVFIP